MYMYWQADPGNFTAETILILSDLLMDLTKVEEVLVPATEQDGRGSNLQLRKGIGRHISSS